VTTKRTKARREKLRQGGYADHSGLFRKKPGRRRSITINPGRRPSPEPVTAGQRAALERRRRVEQYAEDADLAEATGEVWDESG
jgi:hypothetical protein